MKHLLITGATGNIGREVIQYLTDLKSPSKIIAGVRDIPKARQKLKDFTNIEYAGFDFDRSETFDKALSGVDSVFLLRPPHISDVDKYFIPLLEAASRQKVREILFLSVQGAEKSKVIPHNKIERLILEGDFDYIFLRPSYFMQNLTTTLVEDIQNRRTVVLPSGKAPFNWIDVKNIGEVAAILLDKFADYKNRAIEITGYENKDFYHVADVLSEVVPDKISFQSVNPLKFYRLKRKQGLPKGMVMVMLLLHFLPRFQPPPQISKFYELLTGKKPTTLKAFAEREKASFDPV